MRAKRRISLAIVAVTLGLVAGAGWMLVRRASSRHRAGGLRIEPPARGLDSMPNYALELDDEKTATELLRALRGGRLIPTQYKPREFVVVFHPPGRVSEDEHEHGSECAHTACWIKQGLSAVCFLDDAADQEISPRARRLLAPLLRRWWEEAMAEGGVDPGRARKFRMRRDRFLKELEAAERGGDPAGE